jgi:hypothetical protein
MKRIVTAFLALAVLAAVVTLSTTSKHTVPAVYAQSGCSNATLTGNYPFVYKGFDAPGTNSNNGMNNTPVAAVGVLAFTPTNGNAGTVILRYTFVSNGKVGTEGVGDGGTYTVNSDCTGTLTDTTQGLHWNIVTVGGGAELFAIQTDASFTDTLEAKKQ